MLIECKTILIHFHKHCSKQLTSLCLNSKTQAYQKWKWIGIVLHSIDSARQTSEVRLLKMKRKSHRIRNKLFSFQNSRYNIWLTAALSLYWYIYYKARYYRFDHSYWKCWPSQFFFLLPELLHMTVRILFRNTICVIHIFENNII